MGHFIRIVYFVVAWGDWFDVVTNCTTLVVLMLENGADINIGFQALEKPFF